MVELTTERLGIRPFTLDDAPFILRLLNEPSFIENDADRRVRDLEGGARRVVAIVAGHNQPSLRLLKKLGFHSDGTIRMPGEDEDLLCWRWSSEEACLPEPRPTLTAL